MKQWNALPATVRASLQSYAVSVGLSAQAILVAIMGDGWIQHKCDTPAAALAYFGAHWWGGFMGLVFGVGPYYRARQGVLAAKKNDPFSLPLPPLPPSSGESKT